MYQQCAATLDRMPAVLVPIDEIRAMPAGEQPWSTALTFRGGMMHGRTKTLPMMSNNDGPLPFTGYERATADHTTRPVTHWYRCIGWLPERLSWAYDLLDGGA